VTPFPDTSQTGRSERKWAQSFPCWPCGRKSRYRFPVPIEAVCWDCWLKTHDDTRAFRSGHPWPRFHLFGAPQRKAQR
jgi:hypothetical protein